MGRDKDRRRGARAVLTGHYLWEESHVEIARPCLRGRGLCQAASRSSNTDHPHLLIDPRLHCSSSQPLGTLGNWSGTYGAPVPHKALSCNHVHISLLRSKKRRPVTIPFQAHRTLCTDAKRKLPWIRHVAGLLAILRKSRWLISIPRASHDSTVC